jgi:hypothetical protein
MDYHQRRCGRVRHKQRTLRSASALSFMPVSPVIQTGKPPGSRHESLPSHDAPGDFLFDAAPPHRHNLNRDLCPHITFGMAWAFLRADSLNCGNCPPGPRLKARQCSCGGTGKGGRDRSPSWGLYEAFQGIAGRENPGPRGKPTQRSPDQASGGPTYSAAVHNRHSYNGTVNLKGENNANHHPGRIHSYWIGFCRRLNCLGCPGQSQRDQRGSDRGHVDYASLVPPSLVPPAPLLVAIRLPPLSLVNAPGTFLSGLGRRFFELP